MGPALAVIGIVVALPLGINAQGQPEVYLLVLDKQGVPVLDIKPSDIRLHEDAGPGTVSSVTRFGWPLKLTVLVDNGPHALALRRLAWRNTASVIAPDAQTCQTTEAPGLDVPVPPRR